MTTGGGYPSLSDASEEAFDSECYNCSQDGRHVKAEVYCVDCGDNFCGDCINVHNKMARMKTHQILDKSGVRPGTTQGVQHPPTEKCLQHHGKLIDTYCRTHDAVCCSVCVSLNHATCADKSYIPTIAKGISSSKEFQDTNKATNTIKQQLDKLQDTKRKNLETIRAAKDDSLARTKRHKEKMIQYIEKLEETTATEILERYRKLEDAVRDDLDEMSKLIKDLEEIQNNIQKSMNNESKLFVLLKQGKEALSDSEKLTYDSKSDIEIPTLYEIDDSVETCLSDLKTLGRFVDIEYNSAVPLSDENIKSSADTETCRITGICSLYDGGLMIADYNNKCLKKLDQNFQIQSRLTLPNTLWDVCQTSRSELAVSMYSDKKIQFVSVGQALSLTRSFSTSGDGYCFGIAYRNGRLYVGRQPPGCSVQVYNMSGTLLQTIQNDQEGTPIISVPAHIVISARSSNINIADINKGLVTLDKSGRLLAQITDPEDLKEAFGVCALPGDQLLVCGRYSHNVVQFDAQGKKVRTLLTRADGLNLPEMLHFDTRFSRLVVGMQTNDKIKVFRLVRQKKINCVFWATI